VRGISIFGAQADVRPACDRAANDWTWWQDCNLVMQLLVARRLKVAPMISAIYPWRKAVAAYECLRQNDGAKLGLLIDWESG
jgi:hypothetical protein